MRLGRLVDRPEWVEEGLAAALKILEADGPNAGWRGGPVVEFLIESGRGIEAEKLVTERWIDIRRATPDRRDSSRRELQSCLATLAGIYHHAGRHDDVLALLAEAKDWDEADLAPLLTKFTAGGAPLGYVVAVALAAQGRQGDARLMLLRLLERAGGYDPAYELLLRLGGDDLLATLDALAARDRFEERPLIWKAKLLLDAGRIPEAEQTARGAIAIDPSDGEQGKGNRLRAYAVLGDILARKGDAAQAATMRGAVAAIRLSEEADDWWQAGLLTRAVQKYETALGRFTDAYCIQSRLALRHAELGDPAKAEEHYRRAFELMPDSFGRVESHCFGCEGAFRGEQAQGIAERVFTRLVKERPDKAQNFYLLGYLREEQERLAEAAESYRRAAKLDPEYVNAWSRLLLVSERVALPRAEREAATLALVRLDPDNRHRAFQRIYSAGPMLGERRLAPVGDFRALWAVLAANARRAAPASDVYPLPASRVELERLRRAESESVRGSMVTGASYYNSRDIRRTTPPTAAALLAQHPMVAGVAKIFFMSRQPEF